MKWQAAQYGKAAHTNDVPATRIACVLELSRIMDESERRGKCRPLARLKT
jgi:hypothetical protein